MITAIDTNILLDILIPTAPHAQESRRALIESGGEGTLVVSEPVVAEVAPRFSDLVGLERFLRRLQIDFEPSASQTLFQAGMSWQTYVTTRPNNLVCPQCGAANPTACINCGVNLRPRQHVLADFMIGAHALHHADQLLTRDRGFYASYFPELRLA